MRWFDRHPAGQPEQWSGLGLVVEHRGRPTLRVEGAAPRLIRLCIGPSPMLWARLAPRWAGFWWLRTDATPALIPPLRADAARAVQGSPDSARWLAAWSRIFARHLDGALDDGIWRLEPARGPGLRSFDDAATDMPPVLGLRALTAQPRRAFEAWDLNGSGAVIGLRTLSRPDAGRIKALRKRARDGSLAPLLLFFVGGLDACVLLDGHDRLQAALLEERAPAALVLNRVRTVRYAARQQERAALWRSVGDAFARLDAPYPSAVDRLNRHLIAGFADPEFERSCTRAWPLPGGASRWRAEVAARAPDWRGLG